VVGNKTGVLLCMGHTGSCHNQEVTVKAEINESTNDTVSHVINQRLKNNDAR